MPTRDEILIDLLERVKALEEWRAQQKTDPWQEEFSPPEPFEITADTKIKDHVGAPLAPATGQRHPDDPEEDTPAVLEAKARIEQANAEDVMGKLHYQEVRVDPTQDGVVIQVPKPLDSQVERRERVAEVMVANIPGLDEALAAKAYIKGGPVWLYTYNRDHVVGLPASLHTELVQDVAEQLPDTAHEMARDLFKVTDPDIQSAWAHDKMEVVRGQMDSGLMGPEV